MFWFVDTRKEGSKPFAIPNGDVAKTWSNEHALENGPFKPVKGPEDFKVPTQGKDEKDPETDENGVVDSIYNEMNKDELKSELEARGIDFASKATKPDLIKLLIEDDGNGGE